MRIHPHIARFILPSGYKSTSKWGIFTASASLTQWRCSAMYTYVARQPILNKKGHTLGYELLFRDGENNAFPAHIEANRATYRLIVENFLAVGRNPALAASRCFINFPQESLIRLLPMSLPKKQIVVEVLESCQPTDELLDAIRYLHRQGYMIALDDFTFAPEWERFVAFAHIIKVDLMQVGVERACEYVKTRLANGSKCKFLAERVETHEEFEQAKQAGFQFFQGFFFSRPEMVKNRSVKPEQVLAMELFQEICQDEVDFTRVEAIITQDISLSYQLLRFVNNATQRIEVPISSFRQALVYLGQDKLKQFVSLVAASRASNHKPTELYKLSLQRARFCSLMARYPQFQAQADQAFLIGLFSLLDSLLDHPLDHLVALLPLCPEVKNALLHRTGKIGHLLSIQESFEQADWLNIERLCQQMGLRVEEVKHQLLDALKWSQEIQLVVAVEEK